MSLFAELKRRNVIRVGLAYLVAGWLLIEAGSLILDIYNAPEWIIQVIVALIAIGLPVAVFFAWAFEITPEGIKREHEVDRTRSVTHETARRLDIITIVLVVIAVALLGADRFLFPDRPAVVPVAMEEYGRASVAVLPFVNMSGNPENEYFSDGLTETLLHMLAQVDELKVAARTSSFAFKGTNTDVREIAAQLGVATLLEGSVQRQGDRVRVTAQLIDAAEGSHIWSEVFDRDLDDVFAIQDEIADSVARSLTGSLLGAGEQTNAADGIASLGTRSTVAYDHYLRGLDQRAQASYISLPAAEQALKQALIADPGFREARITLAETYLAMSDTGLIPHAEAGAQASAVLEPLTGAGDPVSDAYIAYVEFKQHSTQRFLSDAEMRVYLGRIAAAIVRAPNEVTLYSLATEILFRVQGGAEEALDFIQRGLELDPLSVDLWSMKGRLEAFVLSRDEAAMASFRRIAEIAPDNPNPYVWMSFVHARRGELAQALGLVIRSAELDDQDHELAALVAENAMELGMLEQARPWVERAMLLEPEGAATLSARMRSLWLSGDRDEAMAIAEQVISQRMLNRRGVFDLAARVYATIRQQRGESAAALAFFESVFPGATLMAPGATIEDVLPSFIERRSRLLQMELMPPEAWREHANYIAEELDRLIAERGRDWRSDDAFAVSWYTLGLESLDTAAAALARHLEQPRRYDFDTQLLLSSPMLSELRAHPDVVAALERVEALREAQAQLYRQMVERGEVPGL